MERDALCKLHPSNPRNLQFDVNLLPFHQFPKFPDFSWPVLVPLWPTTVVLQGEAQDFLSAILFGEAQPRQSLCIFHSVYDVDSPAACDDVLELPQESTYGFFLCLIQLGARPLKRARYFIFYNISKDKFVNHYTSINNLLGKPPDEKKPNLFLFLLEFPYLY